MSEVVLDRSVLYVCMNSPDIHAFIVISFFFFAGNTHRRAAHTAQSQMNSHTEKYFHIRSSFFPHMMVVLPHKNTHTFLCNIFIWPGLFNGNIHSCLIIIGEKKSPRVTAQKENIYGFMRSM